MIIPATTAAAVSFNRSFLALKKQAPRTDQIGLFIFTLAIVLSFVALVAPYALVIKLDLALLVIGCGFVTLTGIQLWNRGYRPARYYVISWAAVVIGALLLTISKAGFLPSNMITDNGVIVGAVPN